MLTNANNQGVYGADHIFRLKRIWILLLIPISFGNVAASRYSEWFSENIMARGVFKWISTVLSFLTGLLPFSLMEWAIIILPVIFVVFLVIMIVKLIKKIIAKAADKRIGLDKSIEAYNVIYPHAFRPEPSVSYYSLKVLLNIFCIAAAALFMLTAGCTCNYNRKGIADVMGLEVKEPTESELINIVTDLADKAGKVRNDLSSYEDGQGVFRLPDKAAGIRYQARDAVKELSESYDEFDGYTPLPKLVFFSEYMSKIEITGVFCPFTMEANVDADIPDYSIASTMCHELAHLHGYIREDEADFISYYACVNSDNEIVRYSGLMSALIEAGNALAETDMDAYTQIRARYPDAVNRDLADNSSYWAQFDEKPAAITANSVNDAYIKMSGDSNGVISYDLMVNLLAAQYRKQAQ